MVGNDLELRLRIRDTQVHRTFFIALKDTNPHDEAGKDAHHQHQKEYIDLHAPESRYFHK